MTSATNIDLFNSFSVFWGTANCSNDAIWGVVVARGVQAFADRGRGFAGGATPGRHDRYRALCVSCASS